MTGRVDGPDKVTGRARYAFEYPVEGAAYAWAVPSVIARGTIRSVDAAAGPGAAGCARRHHAGQRAAAARHR